MEPMLKAHDANCYDKLLSSFGFKFNLRRYSSALSQMRAELLTVATAVGRAEGRQYAAAAKAGPSHLRYLNPRPPRSRRHGDELRTQESVIAIVLQ